MRFVTGDVVFTRDGRPGVVVGRDPITEHIDVERKGPNLKKVKNFGLVNGLTPPVRAEYEKIVKEARQHEAPEDRVSYLKEKVDAIGFDPKKWVLKRYLQGEMSYIINSEGVHPRTFRIDEKSII